MGIVFRQSIKSTAITFFGALLGAAVMFVSTNLIPRQELGFVRNLISQTVIASFFVLMGFNNTLFYYFHRFDNDKHKRAVFLSVCFGIPIVILVLSFLPYCLFPDYFVHFFKAEDIPFMRKYFLCLPLFTLFYMYSALTEHYLIVQMKVATSSFIKEVILRGLNLLMIVLFGLGYIDFTVFIYGFVCVNLITLFLLLYLASRNDSFRFSANWKLFSRSEYGEILKFSGYHAMMGTSYFLIGFLDSLLLAVLDQDGLRSIPVYTNAVFISSVMAIPYRVMNSVAGADLNKAYTAKDHDKVQDVFGRSGLNILIASVFMAVIIACNLHNAVAIMGPGYGAVVGVTLLMLIGKLSDCGTGLNDIALNMSPYYRINFYLSIGVVALIAIADYVLIPRYGIYGAAWVMAGSMLIYNLAKSYFAWTKMGLQPFSKGSVVTLFIGAVTAGLTILIPEMANPYLDTILRCLVILAVFAGMVLWLKPSKDVEHYIEETLKKKRLF